MSPAGTKIDREANVRYVTSETVKTWRDLAQHILILLIERATMLARMLADVPQDESSAAAHTTTVTRSAQTLGPPVLRTRKTRRLRPRAMVRATATAILTRTRLPRMQTMRMITRKTRVSSSVQASQ